MLASTGGLVVPLIGAGMGGRTLQPLLGRAARQRDLELIPGPGDGVGELGIGGPRERFLGGRGPGEQPLSVLTGPSWRKTI